ncbi:MAG: thrombospondin type 3 repeat-containing protein, partial [Acidobacteria bacterium]|nr:thrombospondin type 3 repeat-containing protein [Acidobacteriota bacterium]
ASITSGQREKADGTWRMRIEIPGLDLHDDVGGQRSVFDGEMLRLVTDRGAAPRFVESGEPVLLLPATGNGAATTFASLLPEVFFADVPRVFFGRMPRSSGSDRFIPRSRVLSPLTSCRIETGIFSSESWHCFPLDRDDDHIANHLDHCPDVRDRFFVNFDMDTDRDGIGTLCDPDDPPGSTVPDFWIDVSTGFGPGPREGAAAVYDPARGVTVLFGGAADTATWEFDGGSWSMIETPDAPVARRDHRLVYDTRRRRVLLFGGQRIADGETLNDSWSYKGNRWTEIKTRTRPAPRAAAGLAYDVENDRLVLFGGRDGPRILDDTWLFDGSSWRRTASPRFPEARYGHQMVYDPFRRLTVLQGGVTAPGAARQPNGTWEFDGTIWQPVDHRGEIPPTWNGVMTFDTGRRQVVIFGGRVIFQDPGPSFFPGIISEQITAATRLYDGATWTALPTGETAPPRMGHAAAFDTTRSVLVVHGGTTRDGALGITEELHRPADVDGDEIPDHDDNCPLISNVGQNDSDGDGSGDACDNCPDVSNPAQRDLDRDLRGDACDPDSDGDGVANGEDVCPSAFVDGRFRDSVREGGGPDSDGDGIADDCDICPGDPKNDVDRDGVCGDRDNCPAAFNSRQDDTNADGAGDACQPFVDILSIQPINRSALRASVGFENPDHDALHGAVRIHPTATLVDVVPRLEEGCALAFLPDGVAGEGIVYGRVLGSAPVIADADAALGCVDGIADFEMRAGRCDDAQGPLGFGISLALTREPFPICVRRRAGGGPRIDYDVLRIGGDDLLLGPIGPATVQVPIAGMRLPGQVDLEALAGPGIYLLAIELTDGTTPAAFDRELFVREDEKRLSIQTARGGDKG